jgi:Fe-S-cluster containining protein
MTTETPFPFPRTTCACSDCVQCCKDQPGSLIPGDFEKIADHLQISHAEARAFFWASPGALVMNLQTGRQFRIGTITPRATRKKGCIFLDENNRCKIHPVAPAGCAYFDTHMNSFEGRKRGNEIARRQQDPDYQRLRSELPFADSYKPKGY